MIDHKLKFIYIHIDKTGGTSIASSLWPDLRIAEGGTYHDAIGKHWSIKRYNDNAGRRAKYEKYFKFAFVRNPWDRAVSKYFFDRKINEDKSLEKSFKSWLKGRKGLRPQLNYLTINDEVVVDFIGRFENLQRDMNKICDKLNIQRKTLPHANPSKHEHYTKYYDAETREIISERYAKDIEYFGYKFGD